MKIQFVSGCFYWCLEPWHRHFDFREYDCYAWFAAWEIWMEAQFANKAWWDEMNIADRIDLWASIDAACRPPAWKRAVAGLLSLWNGCASLVRRVAMIGGGR